MDFTHISQLFRTEDIEEASKRLDNGWVFIAALNEDTVHGWEAQNQTYHTTRSIVYVLGKPPATEGGE